MGVNNIAKLQTCILHMYAQTVIMKYDAHSQITEADSVS